MLESLLIIVVLGILAPFLGFYRGLRSIGWLYLALIPLFMYHKSLFTVTHVAGIEVQWPTLAKDVSGLILLLLLVGSAVFGQRRLLLSEHRRALKIVTAFIVYWIGSALLLGQSMSMTVLGVRPYAFYTVVGICLGAFLFSEEGSVSRFARLLLVITGLVAVVALVQAYVWSEFLVHAAMRDVWLGSLVEWEIGGRRLAAYFTSPNTLGFFMGLGILAAAWCVREEHGSSWRYVALVTMPILTWVLILTLSRTALLGTVGGALVLLWCMGVGRRARGLLLGGFALLLIVTLVGTGFSERFSGVTDNPRLLYWGAFLLSSFSSPTSAVFGHGVGSIGRFGAEVSEGGLAVEAVAEQIGTSEIFFVDNFYVRAQYETGLLGILFLAWAVWISVRAFLWLHRRQAHSERVRRLALPVAVMAFVLMISVLTSSFGTFPWNLLFWMSASSILLVWSRTRSGRVVGPASGVAGVPR